MHRTNVIKHLQRNKENGNKNTKENSHEWKLNWINIEKSLWHSMYTCCMFKYNNN